MVKTGFILFLILFGLIAFEINTLWGDKVSNVSKKHALYNACNELETPQKMQCWENVMESTLNTEGLDNAFELMDSLFNSDPLFASECHGLAHLLGEKAYQLFSTNQDFTLSSKASYCGYGFYHGFMEKLLLSGGKPTEARKFCEDAGKKLREETVDAEGACFHGIGHGAVEDVTDPTLFGDSQAIIQPSLLTCEQVSDTEDKLFRCVTGVFNGLEIVSTQKRYELSLNYEDPLWICRIQPEKYKRACYTQFVVAVMNVTNTDFDKSAQILDTIPENAYAQESLSGLVVELVRMGKTDHKQTLDYCHSLSSRFQLPCVTGFAEGFLKYGPPQKEYVGALEFCKSELLTNQERQACYNRVLPLLRILYTVEKSRQICQLVDKEYRGNCLYN